MNRFDTRYKGAKTSVDLALTDSLFQTAGARMEKEREASEVEVNEILSHRTTEVENLHFAHCIVIVDSLAEERPKNTNVIYTPIKSTFSGLQLRGWQ